MYWHSDTHILWMVVFWIGVIAASAVGLRYALGGPRGVDRGESPEDILKKRYARGDIDREEYESRLADLRK